MKASQSVYLNFDRTKAVPEGHADARFLLVREDHEIDDAEVEKYDGASSLVGSKRKGPSVDDARPEAGTLEPQPKPKKVRAKKAAKARK